MKQLGFQKPNWKHRYAHGGSLRNARAGRFSRPLSGKDPVHLVFKAHRQRIKSGFRTYKRYFLIHKLIDRYSRRFFVKIEQISVQGDHLHLLIRTGRRSNFQSFFRVVAGQIAQQFEKQELVTDTPAAEAGSRVTDTPKAGTGLWKHRPFTRVVKGWRAYRIVRDYIQLNEREALGVIDYNQQRLRGLSREEWQALWS